MLKVKQISTIGGKASGNMQKQSLTTPSKREARKVVEKAERTQEGKELRKLNSLRAFSAKAYPNKQTTRRCSLSNSNLSYCN